jgi:hypothetical protein
VTSFKSRWATGATEHVVRAATPPIERVIVADGKARQDEAAVLGGGALGHDILARLVEDTPFRDLLQHLLLFFEKSTVLLQLPNELL